MFSKAHAHNSPSLTFQSMIPCLCKTIAQSRNIVYGTRFRNAARHLQTMARRRETARAHLCDVRICPSQVRLLTIFRIFLFLWRLGQTVKQKKKTWICIFPWQLGKKIQVSFASLSYLGYEKRKIIINRHFHLHFRCIGIVGNVEQVTRYRNFFAIL